MINKINYSSIRILPCSNDVFHTEDEFREFITETMTSDVRKGRYYFPNKSLVDSIGALVLFQYDAKIRAVGIIQDVYKGTVYDEKREKYQGYYNFDTSSIKYLDNPIDTEMIQAIYPSFTGFNRTMHKIPEEYWNDLLSLIYDSNDTKEMEIIEEDMNFYSVEGLDKEVLVKSRINQGEFRRRLKKKYSSCSICGCAVGDNSFLIASHIKPWSQSTPEERTDVNNGFLMCPNHDKAFDKGIISFSDDGNILISGELSEMDRVALNIRMDMYIKLSNENKKYLKYHRDNIFIES